jgi:hypothetical protein
MRRELSVAAGDFDHAGPVGQRAGLFANGLDDLPHEHVDQLLPVHRQHRVIGRVVQRQVQAGRTNDVQAASLRDRDKCQHAATCADGHRVDHPPTAGIAELSQIHARRVDVVQQEVRVLLGDMGSVNDDVLMRAAAPQPVGRLMRRLPPQFSAARRRRYPNLVVHVASSGRQVGTTVAPPGLGSGFGDFVGSLQYCADPAEAFLQVSDVDAASPGVGVERHRCGKTCRLTHTHRLAHATAARVRVVRRAEATADYPHLFAALRHERSVRHAVNAGLGLDVTPDGFFLAGSALAVVLDGGAAKGDLVVELSAAEAVVLRQSLLAVDAPRLAHADVMGEANDLRPLVAGHHVAQVVLVDERLPTALDLRGGELLRVRRVDVADAHGNGCVRFSLLFRLIRRGG